MQKTQVKEGHDESYYAKDRCQEDVVTAFESDGIPGNDTAEGDRDEGNYVPRGAKQ
jgi:hypothetical protein